MEESDGNSIDLDRLMETDSGEDKIFAAMGIAKTINTVCPPSCCEEVETDRRAGGHVGRICAGDPRAGPRNRDPDHSAHPRGKAPRSVTVSCDL